VRCSAPPAGRTMTVAPGTTAPEASLTTPETVLPARTANSEKTAMIMGLNYTAEASGGPLGERTGSTEGRPLLAASAARRKFVDAHFERVDERDFLLVGGNGTEIRDDRRLLDADVLDAHLH